MGKREKQGREFSFSNRKREVFPWTDKVSIDDPSFQGLLEPDVSFPDISTELPGVELEDTCGPQHVVVEKVPPDEAREAALALENAGLDCVPGPQLKERGFAVGVQENAANVFNDKGQDENAGEAPTEEAQEELPPGVPVVENGGIQRQ